MPEVPRFIRLFVAALSGVILASAAVGAVMALAANDRPAWALVGFEIVIAVSCVFGVLLGAGRYRQAPGLALACVAGTVFAGSALGFYSLSPPVLGGVGLKPLLAARVLAAGLIAGAGAYCILSRHPRSWRLAARGVLLGVPVLGAAAVVAVPSLRRVLTPVLGLGLVGQMVIAVGAFLILGALLCASVDLIIRAFELGRPERFQSPGVTRA